MDEVQQASYASSRQENFTHYDSVDVCFEALSKFLEQANDYEYNPYDRAKQFEKAAGIQLLKKE